MSLDNRNTIYLISGPCGVGKSTVAKALYGHLKHAALIDGDAIMSMFPEGHEPPWEEHLAITWENILSMTKSLIRHKFDVVIDFVVETEFEWFSQQAADLEVALRYVVLRADKETLVKRLEKRGDPELVDRSLFLLSELEGLPFNQKNLYDTTHTQPSEIVENILTTSRFTVR